MPSVGTVGGTIAVSILCVALVYGCVHKETHKVAPPPAPVVRVVPKAAPTPFHCRIFHCAVPKAKPVVVAPKAVPTPAPAPTQAAPAPAAPVKYATFCDQVKAVVAEHGKAWALARAKELNYTAPQIAAVQNCMK
jgi:hypothetical protein